MEKGSGQAAVTSRLWDYQCPFVAVLEQRETLCCQKGERKKEEKKKTTHNLARGMLLLQKKKHRYQIKKVCLKTVHMPAPGDFKYLWFATFLIFKRSRDAAHRI